MTPHLGATRVGALVGPTAVGKSALGVELAERLGADILSADSTAVYRGMDIGTDKPSALVRSRVPHHLLDLAEPHERFSVAHFCAAAEPLVRELAHRGRRPLFVGGTGLYVRAATLGYEFAGAPPDLERRERLLAAAAQEGTGVLLKRLRKLDPVAAARVDSRNARRVVRALEVALDGGAPPAGAARPGRRRDPSDRLVVALTRDRQALYRAIERRVERELADGLADEVAGLLARYPEDLPAFRALGYKEVIPYVRGRIRREDMVATLARHTRHFAKRQYTWFRGAADVVWLDLDWAGERATDLLSRWFHDFFETGRHPAPLC